MINRILVPLDLSDYAEAATQRACEISKAHRAQVMGMVVVNTPELMGRRFGLHRLSAETENVKAEQLRRLQQRVELGLGKFRETCDQARVTFVGDQVEGLPEDRLLDLLEVDFFPSTPSAGNVVMVCRLLSPTNFSL